jgi:hypothetical protein
MSQLDARSRDLTLKVLGRARKILPGTDLTFNNPPARYDGSRDVIFFDGTSLGHPVRCAVSGEALEDHFGADGGGQNGRLEAFRKHRSKIERHLRTKYLSEPVEEAETVLLRTADVKNSG